LCVIIDLLSDLQSTLLPMNIINVHYNIYYNIFYIYFIHKNENKAQKCVTLEVTSKKLRHSLKLAFYLVAWVREKYLL
jgi:hypothetical protein